MCQWNKIRKEYQIRQENKGYSSSIQVFKYSSIQVFNLEFDQSLTNNVKARDPVGSNYDF